TFVAITAETEGAADGKAYADASAATGPKSDASTATKAPTEFKWGKGVKTLIVGGGSSHDFNKWFNLADRATLSEGGKASVNYTDQPAAVAAALKEIDVLYQSSNQKMDDPGLRKAIME